MFGKVNVKGGLTGGWPHFVKPTTFANGGFTQAVKVRPLRGRRWRTLTPLRSQKRV